MNIEDSNQNMGYAATQLLNAVCGILENYTSRVHNIDQEIEEQTRYDNNIDQRVVRFDIKPPPPPHSSRSNTKTRNSLPDLPLTSLPMHCKNNSSPSHKMMVESGESKVNHNNDTEHPISAKKIKHDFAKWMKVWPF